MECPFNSNDLNHHKLVPFCPFGVQCGVVGAGAPQGLFQTERYDPNGGSEMQYAFPVTNGDMVAVGELHHVSPEPMTDELD